MENEENEDFTLSLTGDGIDLVKQVDRKAALAILSIVWGEAAPQLAPATQSAGGPNADVTRLESRQSMGEFLDDANASTSKERIVSIGYYLRTQKGVDAFTKDDLVAGFRSAHEPLPKNITRDISTTAAARWIEEIDSSGSFYVTSTGAKVVNEKFGK
ncbi:hypothetical protein L0664_16510 [Octadecabacter sp. G9-8]|uniref:Uncharacterized protein n=1 Tax=Octadecabacter dasysiphoniae TaxID=2909341 RepID=A0ABS9CZH6_9RHOB|nr:hypothetical protein [Octadecabacter dasysiphoniae]MCF2872676.1 hypothetical protein [Octadecabacter dasysiphoniae]